MSCSASTNRVWYTLVLTDCLMNNWELPGMLRLIFLSVFEILYSNHRNKTCGQIFSLLKSISIFFPPYQARSHCTSLNANPQLCQTYFLCQDQCIKRNNCFQHILHLNEHCGQILKYLLKDGLSFWRETGLFGQWPGIFLNQSFLIWCLLWTC